MKRELEKSGVKVRNSTCENRKKDQELIAVLRVIKFPVDMGHTFEVAPIFRPYDILQ